jgi:hypothetical protein
MSEGDFMALLHIPLRQIDEACLEDLIVSRAAESRTIDYKRTTYGSAHADYSEFLADASSFANTSGGDLVLGIDATDGIPTAVTPLTIQMDSEKLRLEQVARGGLQPRIASIAFQSPIQAGGNVLVIRIPRSYNPPHRVIRQGSNRFWARSTAGKYEPDVNELRTLFSAGPQLADRIRNFRLDRIAKIAAGQAPVQLMNQGTIILHVVPLSAFDVTPGLPLGQIERNFASFVPLGSSTANGVRINFEGVLKTSNANPRATEQRAYLQLYRNGIVESVDSSLIARSSGQPIVISPTELLIQGTIRILNDLSAVGVGPPYALLVSLIGVAGAQFNFSRERNIQWSGYFSDGLDRDQYHFAEVIFEAIPTDRAECAQIIRPTLDQMANVAGIATSPNFDDQGRYIPMR